MQEIQEIIDNRTFLNDIKLNIMKVYEREDNVKFIMCMNDTRPDLACILRYDHCLDIWEMPDYMYMIKQKFDDLVEEFTRDEVIRDEVTRDEVIRDEVIRDEVIRDEVIRDEVTRDEVIRDEVTRDEVIKEDILQELEHVHDEIFERLKALEESAKTQVTETSEIEIDYEKVKELFKSFNLNIVIIDYEDYDGSIFILAMSEDRQAYFMSVDYHYNSVTFLKKEKWFEGKEEYYKITGS